MEEKRPADLAAILKQALEQPDPYLEPGVPGPNPGGAEEWKKLVASLGYRAPLVRNVALGPMVASTCQCPQCGELFVFYVEHANRSHDNVYHACLGPDEQPLCYRCKYATAWPQLASLNPKLITAMVETRWRLTEYLEAGEAGSMKSQAQMREAFLKAHEAFWLHGPMLLTALEYVFGDQLKAAVAAIEGGVSGVR